MKKKAVKKARKKAAKKETEENEGGILPKSKKEKKGPGFIRVPGLEQEHWLVPIIGITPIVMNRLGDKAALGILKAQYAPYVKGAKRPEAANPLEIFAGSIHQVDNCAKPKTTSLVFPFAWDWEHHKAPMKFEISCVPGFPTIALKKAICYAAVPMEKVSDFWVDRAIHVQGNMLSIDYRELKMVKIDSRNDKGTPIQSFLPAFCEWETTAAISVMPGKFDWEGIQNLVNGAGRHAGLAKQRPEKDGQFGMFMVDTSRPMRNISEETLFEWILNHGALQREAKTKILNLKEIITREEEKPQATKKVARKKSSKVQ